jgi:hypothetical protein
VSPNITSRREGVRQCITRHFSKFLNNIKTFFNMKFPISEQKKYTFLKNENVWGRGGEEGSSGQCHNMTHGGEGV